MAIAPSTLQLWQLKLAFAEVLRYKSSTNLLSSETLLALKYEAISILDNLEKNLCTLVRAYLSGANLNCCSDIGRQVSAFVTFYDIPFSVNVSTLDQLLEVCVRLQSSGYSSESISKIIHVLGM